ncbi:putative pumilio [Cardamine amara subsp. amara]|uniref:Pumilio n=1 Tax=Cardamine amara subsp. amara TaxID=228776 RepID=A0ABD1ABP0_CARAN
MKMGEFQEPSSPLKTPNINFLRQNLFHGDFSSSNNKFSFTSTSDYSVSSSFSNGLYSSEDSYSPFSSPPFNGIISNHNHTSPVSYHHHQQHDDSLFHKDNEKSINGHDDFGLCEDLYRMKIRNDVEEDQVSYGRAETQGSMPKSDHSDGYVSGGFPCGFFRPTNESSSVNDSWLNQNNDDKRNMFRNNSLQVQDSIANSQQLGWSSYSSSNSGMSLNGGAAREYSPPQQPEILYNHQSYRAKTTTDMLPFFCQGGTQVSKCSEESFFMEGKRSGTRALMPEHGNTTEMCHLSLPNMCDIQGCVYLMAKDQHGCRFLQRIFDEGTSIDAMIIFNEVIAHVVELMMDPFGNYLMQKLLDVCTEEQRTQIVLVATSEPGQLIRISLNAYGTRVVQRLVETIRTGKQISLVKSALRPGFLDLIKDLNGNHVIQRCLQCLGTEDNKFIFDAATKYCTEIATHRHGCCVLQKCIAYSMRQQREKLIAEISRNSLLLAQDPFGNYAVQFVIELRIPSAVAMMLAQLKGHYVELSMQKFSSHMVERCLMHCPESRPQIVRELVSVPHFDHLLQDPYANFVIQAALAATKGPLHASLVEVIRPHSILRNNPYCKRIFSRNLLKK